MSRKSQREFPPVEAVIESLSNEGRGVTHIDNKTVFVDGALAGERVWLRVEKKHRNYDEARVEEVLQAAQDRVDPRCAHFGVCGGCSLQHLRADAQIAFKQEGLLQNLERIGKVKWAKVLPPLTSSAWGYRRRARLGVKYVEKKSRVLVGFREKHSHFLADIQQCPVLHEDIGTRLVAVAALIESLSIPKHIPQIEVARGDEKVVLIFRHLQPFNADDLVKLEKFARETGFAVFLQPGDMQSIHPLTKDDAVELSYALPEFDVNIHFTPTQFTQVNAGINRAMVKLAIDLLDPQPTDTVMDLFCGVGNFSLPLARKSGHVIGVEGEAALVKQARENATINKTTNTEFHVADLSQDISIYPWGMKTIDKLLLDPARSGAWEVAKYLHKLQPKRIVYVSCNPATLARDADEIVNNQGYKMESCGVLDMFPHTTHVESIAVFSKKK